MRMDCTKKSFNGLQETPLVQAFTKKITFKNKPGFHCVVEPAMRVVLVTSELALLDNRFQTLFYFTPAILLPGCATVWGQWLRRSSRTQIENAYYTISKWVGTAFSQNHPGWKISTSCSSIEGPSNSLLYGEQKCLESKSATGGVSLPSLDAVSWMADFITSIVRHLSLWETKHRSWLLTGVLIMKMDYVHPVC